MREWSEEGGKKKILLIGAVVLIVVAAAGLILASGGGEEEPSASFTCPTSPKVDGTVNFTDSSTGNPTAWSWDFGDGTTSSGQSTTHTYTAVGDYTVTLRVTYPNDVTKTATKNIYVIVVEYPPGPDNYVVFWDMGLPIEENFWGDMFVWSGADWDLPSGEADGHYVMVDAPEGTQVFMLKSGEGSGNYIGGGVFLGEWSYPGPVMENAHTADLSGFSELSFWVKSSVNLKVEIVEGAPADMGGKNSAPVYTSQFGWDSNKPDSWQEIRIPLGSFRRVDNTIICGLFLITGEGSEITYYFDYVRWV